MFASSFITLSKSALKQNLDFIRDLIGNNTTLSSVVKGNAYGHGIETFVPMAVECGITHFSVYNAEEAFRVKEVLGKNSADIMIMGMIANDEIEWAVANDIEFYVFEIDRLEKTIEISSRVGKKARIHLEVETGMNRTGLNSNQLRKAKALLQKYDSNIEVKGICTHFSGAESITNYVRIRKQITNFNRITRWLIKNDVHIGTRHTSCSAAIINYPMTMFDMVRVGIMQYGFWPSKETQINYLSRNRENMNPLKRLITWKSKVMSIKGVKAGEFIGYGTTFLAENDMKVASIPVGYADGFSRSLSNTGRVLIHGVRVSVVGIINMNTMLVDITHVPKTKKGDEVVLIGEQGKLEITLASFGEMSNLMNYELLTRLPSRIPRMVVE